MATEADVSYFREYFEKYESEASNFDLSLAPLMPELDLENCNCVLRCGFKFSLESRMLIRAAYQRLTPEGKTAFLDAHMREPSPGQTQWLLPITGMGLEKVCYAHFMNTLQESRDQVRQVIRDKRDRQAALPDDEEHGEMEYIRDKRRRNRVRQERRARGLSYLIGRNNRVMPARKVRAPCSMLCNYKCSERFPLEVRQAMLKHLLQMPLAKQQQILADHVCKVTPTRRRVKDSGRSTIYYFFEEEGMLHKVCKTMYLNTYDISDRILRSLILKKGANPEVICGNPKLSKLIKREKRIVYDLREGTKGAVVANEPEDFPIDIGMVKVEDIDPEMDESEEEILPDEPAATDESVSETLDTLIKHESTEGGEDKTLDFPIATVDIKSEITEPELEQSEFMVVLPCDEDSINDEELTKDSEVDEDDDSATESSLLEEIQSDSKLVRTKRNKTRDGLTNPARSVKPNCGDACVLKCQLRVSDEVRQQLLAKLLEKSRDEQRIFIGDHICAMNAARVHSFSGRRALCFHYFLPVESRLAKVCRTMFLNTYDLTEAVMRKIVAEKEDKKHVVCGNPYFPTVLRKDLKDYYNYDEGCDEAVLDPRDLVDEDGCKCHLKCDSTFTEKMTQSIQKIFRKTPKDQKQNFLAKYVRLVVDKDNPNKTALFRTRFFLPHGSTTKAKEVCQKMFLRTFQLTTGQVTTLLKNMSENPELLVVVEDPVELAKKHIAALRMDEDHRCGAAGGALRKLSRCPNVARMYNRYLAKCSFDVDPISYQQYYVEFSRTFVRTGLQLPTMCPDCGFCDEGEED